MHRFLLNKLKVLEHEKRAFYRLCLLFGFVFFFMALFRNYVDTTFLKRYGVEHIPLMLVINSLATFAVFGLLGRISTRLSDTRLLAGVFLCYGIGTGLLFWGVRAGQDLCYPILFQLLYLQDSLLLVYLWNIACDLFDSRQGKRLFPLVTAAQVLGVVCGNFGTNSLAALLGRDQILLVYSGSCLVIGAVMLGYKSGSARRAHGPPPAGPSRRLAEIPALMRKYPVVRYLVMLGLLPNILLPIFLYQFSVIVNQGFASEQTLLSFLSIFRGAMTLAVFLLLLAMGRIYARIGVVNASLVLPINFGALFTALTASFSLHTAVIGQFVTRLVQQAVAGPVNKVLFNLVPRQVAGWTRVFVRGTVVKAGMLLGAVMMMALKPVLSPQQLSPLAAAIAFYWIWETFAFKRHFRQSLKQVIAHDAVDFDRIDSLHLQNQGGLVASMPLADDDADTDAADGPPDPSTLTVEGGLAMLQDPDSLIRAQAAAFFARGRHMQAAHRLVALLKDQDMVRKLAVDALVNYGQALQPFLEASLADPHPRQRQGILEVVRLAGMKDFDTGPMIQEELGRIYNRVLFIAELGRQGDSRGMILLGTHLEESNREGLSLIFHALWIKHKDMRLMNSALSSLDASAAVEMVEETLERPLARLLVPLLEGMPPEELIARGGQALPLYVPRGLEGALMHLARSRDRLTRMLAGFVMGEFRPGPVFLPAAEILLDDEDPEVRRSAEYARDRCLGLEAEMPLTIEIIEQLKGFNLFMGLGLREFEALAVIAKRVQYQRGETVTRAGQADEALILVLSGVLQPSGPEAAREPAPALGPGDWLGDLSLFTQAEAAFSYQAGEAVEALVIPFGRLSEIMNIYPGIGITFCRNFAARLQGSESNLAVYDPVDKGADR